MADGFDRLTTGLGRAADEISLNLIRRELLEYMEAFSSLKDDYDNADRGLILESPTLERIRAEKNHMPFDNAVNIASGDEAKVQNAIRGSEGHIWPLQ